jgi:hypothetical protein
MRRVAAVIVSLLTAACGDDGRATASAGATTGPATTSGATSTSTTDAGTTDAVTTGGTATTSTATSTTGEPASTGEPGTTGGATSTTDLPETTGGASTGGLVCPPEDICCLQPGELPPHKLLDAFLNAYPPPMMPKSVAEVQAFTPVAEAHMMAWSDENVGNELVDAGNGGVIEANVQAGRDLARMAAQMAVPVDATLLATKEDPVVIEDLGSPPPCIGVGWGWGSLLFENADQSIGELVYLYIGYCAEGDVERFFYSDQAVEICPPPG